MTSCPTCPFRGSASPSDTLARLRSNPDQEPTPAGWEVGECHDRVGEACAGFEAALAAQTKAQP